MSHMSNRQSALSFLNLAASGNVLEAYEKYVSPRFIHHNQYFKGDRQSLLDAMNQAHQESPNKSLEVKKVLEDGDTVMTYSRVVRKDPEAEDIAIVHIFRFEEDKIAELWDTGQMILKDSPNENGMF